MSASQSPAAVCCDGATQSSSFQPLFVRFLTGSSKQGRMGMFPRPQHLKSFLCYSKSDNDNGNGFVTKLRAIHYHHHFAATTTAIIIIIIVASNNS